MANIQIVLQTSYIVIFAVSVDVANVVVVVIGVVAVVVVVVVVTLWWIQ